MFYAHTHKETSIQSNTGTAKSRRCNGHCICYDVVYYMQIDDKGSCTQLFFPIMYMRMHVYHTHSRLFCFVAVLCVLVVGKGALLSGWQTTFTFITALLLF